MRVAIIFGGSGYIGSFLTKRFIDQTLFDKIYIYDLNPPGNFLNLESEHLVYLKGDVRKPIIIEALGDTDLENSWIFNFAAVHREPGHAYHEYFDTNLPGATHVSDFARQTGIQNMFFTSSIAPYGKSLDQRDEGSNLYPETAYGISKALAEQIHRTWLAEDSSRKLVIVRPSVIYGPHDPGNVYRMIKSLKKRRFILPDKGNVIKAYGYVYGLVDSMLFTMDRSEHFILYNYAENPLVPLERMTKIVQQEFGYKGGVPKIPVPLLVILARFIQMATSLMGKTSDIHPVRVRKAGFPTNIKPAYLIENDFNFKYPFEESLKHWRKIAPEDFS